MIDGDYGEDDEDYAIGDNLDDSGGDTFGGERR